MDIRLDPAATARPQDLPEIADLLEAVFAKERDWRAELPWQYLANPCGPARYVNARAPDGRLVGHYVVIPTPEFADPRFQGLRSYLSLNTAVHPDAQGKGVFKLTARALYQRLQEEGPSVVLGVANANSVKGFLGSLGFAPLGQLGLRFYFPWQTPRVGRPRLLAAGADYLRWRASRPGCAYAAHPEAGVLSRRILHRGVPVAALLSTALDRQALAAVPAGPFPRVAPRLYAASGELSGGIPVPERLRPSPLHFICRLLSSGDPAPLFEHVGQSLFEFLDFDVV